MTARRLALLMITLAFAVGPAGAYAQAPPSMSGDNYVIGPQDIIVIAVFDQPTLGGKYVVEADGSFTFPHLGPIKAAGLTIRALEDSLRQRLGEKLFRNPQVTVGVETYRSKRIFIMGEVRSSGRQQLSGSMTFVEALAAAGGTTPAAAGDAVIVRPRQGTASAPILPGQDKTAEIIEVDLMKLQNGDLSQNPLLRDGDTVYVPRAETAYIFGEVRSPGAYPIQKGMTVLQALSLAGGQTENGALNRIKIHRVENGKKLEIKVKNPLTEIVKPGDTIIVPERWF
jgi:polysaccharide biosynthesis/export protein